MKTEILQKYHGRSNNRQNIFGKLDQFTSSELENCSNLHQLNIYRYVDGTKHVDGICVSEDKGILQGETWIRVSGICCIQLIIVSWFSRIFIFFNHFVAEILFVRNTLGG